jgi:hypothetical protein
MRVRCWLVIGVRNGLLYLDLLRSRLCLLLLLLIGRRGPVRGISVTLIRCGSLLCRSWSRSLLLLLLKGINNEWV